MQLIDLTHSLSGQLSLFPGAPAPQIDSIDCPQPPACHESRLLLNSHHGTHVEAPYHLLPDASPLERLPLENFFGLALMLEVSCYAGGQIPLELLREHEDELKYCEFLVLKSGWDRKWGQPQYLQGYPVLSVEAARYLAGFEFLHGLGMDMISPDAIDSTDCPVHQALMSQGKLIVENLCNLDSIQGRNFLLSCLPLKFSHADASPIRAVAYQAPAGIYYPS